MMRVGGSISTRRRGGRSLRSSLGLPVFCEIFSEPDEDGLPRILGALEIEGPHGFRILSQEEVDEDEVLMLYREWRRRPENRGKVRRIGKYF